LDYLAGVLESVAHVARGLTILVGVDITVIALLVICFMESLGQAKALPHGMICALVDRSWSIEELRVLLIIAMLGEGLIDGGNKVFRSVTSELPGFGAL
jgi:hypothetical protein